MMPGHVKAVQEMFRAITEGTDRWNSRYTWRDGLLGKVWYWLVAHVELTVVAALIGVFLGLMAIMATSPHHAYIQGYLFAASPYGYEQILDDHGNGIRCQ
jgi:hypothetical protein